MKTRIAAYYVVAIIIALAFASIGRSQTNSTWIDYLKSGDVSVFPYAGVTLDHNKFVYGLMASYPVAPYVSVGAVYDHCDAWNALSATVTPNYTYDFTTNFSGTVFGIAATGASVSGANGVEYAFGTGANLLYKINDHFYFGGGFEGINRQNVGLYSGWAAQGHVEFNIRF